MTVLIVISVVSVASWMFLAFLRGFFWRTDPALPPRWEPASWPDVAVVVPARDEAAVLPATLPTLLAQDYPGAFRIVLVDDASRDGTADIARRLVARAGEVDNGTRLRVTSSTEPPPGWTGKLWALNHGIQQAGDVEYLLLTDADIAHGRGMLRALVEAATTQRLDLVSQMARLRTRTGWESLIIPAFVYFFALLHPFRWVNDPRSRVAAAAGGCILVHREALSAAGGLSDVRGAVIDDIAVASLIKRRQGRIWLGLADQIDSTRPYPRLADLWNMVARTAFAQLRYSWWLLAGTVLGLAVVFLMPVVTLIAGLAQTNGTLIALGLVGWLVMAGTYAPMVRCYSQPFLTAFLLPFVAALYLAMTMDSARRHRAGKGAGWKGRTYSATAAGTTATTPGSPGSSSSSSAIKPVRQAEPVEPLTQRDGVVGERGHENTRTGQGQ